MTVKKEKAKKNFPGSYDYRGFEIYLTEAGDSWLIKSNTTGDVNDSTHTLWQGKEVVDEYVRIGVK
jgi:hypothetical protein